MEKITHDPLDGARPSEGNHETKTKRRKTAQKIGAGVLVMGLAAGIGVSAAEAGHVKGAHGYGQMYKLPNGKTEYVGSLKPAENSSMAWCNDWSTMNTKGVKATSVKDVTSKNAAIANYIVQDHLGTPEDYPEIALAIHELLDPGKAKTSDKNQWGYTAKRATGALKTDLARAQGWIKTATDLRGPYRIAPAVAIAPTKKTATLSGTEILSAVNKKMYSFNGKRIKVTATLSGPATFSDGKKTKTFDAGTNQALKITGTGAVKASVKSATVMPASKVKQYAYSAKKSQNKIVSGGLVAAAGTRSVTIVPAGIDTKATDKKDGDQKLSYKGGTIRDRVHYSGLVAGQTYTVSGELMDKATKKATGHKASKSFKPTSTSGYVDVEFNVGAAYSGKTLVAFETIKLGSTAIIAHKDINDKDQSITINPNPTVPSSKATDKADGDQKLTYKGGTVSDSVDYTGLNVGTTYRMDGELMDKATGKSTGIKASTTFKATKENGKVVVSFKVSDKFAGKTMVAFQRLYEGSTQIAKHENINNAAQTVRINVLPTVPSSKATDKADGDQKLTYKGGTVSDSVDYTGLNVGTTYRMDGELMDKATGKSTGIKASTTFKATKENGKVVVSFKVSDKFAGKTLVAFQRLYEGSTQIAKHENINNAAQTVRINVLPTVPTSNATDKKDGDQKLSYMGGTITDSVDYTGLIVGTTYRMDGELMDKATGKSTGIKGSTTFKATKENGKVVVSFKVSDQYPATTLVAFQRLYEGSTLIAKHEEINSKAQSVSIPDYPEMDLQTKARDKSDGDQELLYEGGVITDTVSYVRAVPGHVYTIKGELMDKSTGKGTGIKAEKKFTAETANGSVALDFTVPAGFRNKTLVAFENIFNAEGALEAAHKDLDDKEQTVKVSGPTLGTTATDKSDGDKSLDFEGGIIIDKVKYTGLIPGDTYTLEGEVMDQESGEGTGVKATKKFTPKDDAGTVDIEFVVPKEHHGKTFVVFEWVKDASGSEVAKHTDPTSVPQSFVVEPKPTVGTTASDQVDGDKFLNQAGGVVIDKVMFTGLKPGTEYTVKGEMVHSGTGDNTGIKASKKFTPKTADGSVELEFTIPEGFGGDTLVAFEELVEPNGRVVGEHKDPTDPEQTVYVANIGTTALDAAGGDKNLTQAGGKVIDAIAYTNLSPGTEYTVSGELMRQVTDEAGNITAEPTGILGSTTFLPETPNGEVNVEFIMNETTAGYTFVAFETLKKGETIVAEHTDPKDKAQTVYQADAKTTLRDATDGDQNIVQAGGKVTDTLTYTNLIPGTEYKVTGELMNKITNPDTGEVTSEATGIMGESLFTPEQPNGEVEIDFTIPEGFAGKSLVAFETVSNDVEIVAHHEDINDKEQTVVVASVGTTLFDKKDMDKVLGEEGGNLIDRIEYTNLVPGTEYVATGELMDKETGKSSGLVESTTFTPKEANGTVDVEFTVTDKFAGKALVAFETVAAKKVVVAEHKDINSAEQSIEVEPVKPVAPQPTPEPETPEAPAPPMVDSGLGAGNENAALNGVALGAGALSLLMGAGALLMRKRRSSAVAVEENTTN